MALVDRVIDVLTTKNSLIYGQNFRERVTLWNYTFNVHSFLHAIASYFKTQIHGKKRGVMIMNMH